MRRISIRIADIVFGIEADHRDVLIESEDLTRMFACVEEPDVTIRMPETAFPGIPEDAGAPVFRSRDMWSIYGAGQRTLLVQMSPFSSRIIERFFVLDATLRYGELFVRVEAPEPVPLDPLQHPLGQVLMVSLLALGRGLMFHAAAIEHLGKGYLFVGNSGDGKSTMSELWSGKGRILNDDRVVVRFRNGAFRMYPTPWHGSHCVVTAAGAPLSTIFVLAKAEEPVVRPLSLAEACCSLLQRSFPPLWSRQGMSYTMTFLEQLARAVSVHELSFVPRTDVVELVECAK